MLTYKILISRWLCLHLDKHVIRNWWEKWCVIIQLWLAGQHALWLSFGPWRGFYWCFPSLLWWVQWTGPQYWFQLLSGMRAIQNCRLGGSRSHSQPPLQPWLWPWVGFSLSEPARCSSEGASAESPTFWGSWDGGLGRRTVSGALLASRG